MSFLDTTHKEHPRLMFKKTSIFFIETFVQISHTHPFSLQYKLQAEYEIENYGHQELLARLTKQKVISITFIDRCYRGPHSPTTPDVIRQKDSCMICTDATEH